MTDIVDPGSIEKIVGAPRSLAHHYGRAVSAEQRIYILHSKVCLDSGIDLRSCPFSVALDLGESQVVPLQRDVPRLLGITADGLLADLTLAGIFMVDAVAHATPSTAAALGPGTERQWGVRYRDGHVDTYLIDSEQDARTEVAHRNETEHGYAPNARAVSRLVGPWRDELEAPRG